MTTRRQAGLLTAAVTAAVVIAALVLTPTPHGSSAPPTWRAAACSRWAAPTGSDSAAGDLTSPVRTAARLVALLQPGETGCLRTGTYRGDLSLTQDRTTLRSAPGERAVLLLSTLEIADGAEDVTVSDLDIIGGADSVTVRPIGDRFRLERNDITNHHEGRSCVLVGGAHLETTGGVIRSNVIQLYPRGVNAVVRGNVIDGGGGSVRGGIVVDGPVAQHDVIEDKVITDTRTGAVVQRSGSGHVALDNCFWDNPTDVTGSGIRSSGNVTDADGRPDLCPIGAAGASDK